MGERLSDRDYWISKAESDLNTYATMTSTPVSLHDESLNGSWIDINSASQIHSPVDDDSPERLRPPYSLAESVQSLGLLSFQVERFLQEAQKNQGSASGVGGNQDGQQQPPQAQYQNVDNISDLCFSDSDMSNEDAQAGKTMMASLQSRLQSQYNSRNAHDSSQRMSKSGGDCFVDQLSDSLSYLSRASLFGDTANLRSSASQGALDRANNFQDFDWLWDWTAQPEYFTGQEWKVSPPKQEFLMKQRQLYSGVSGSSSLASRHDDGRYFPSGHIMSLLFLTNILSIIIGAGITYSILVRRSNL